MHDPRVLERRFSAGAYGSPSQNISIKKPQKMTMLDTDSVAGTPSSLGSTPPASPSMASPSSCKCEWEHLSYLLRESVIRPLKSQIVLMLTQRFDSFGGCCSAATDCANHCYHARCTDHKEKDNIWRSVFHPGQNTVMRKVGSDKFDKAQPNSPTVYDW